jgi:hypothetical protein
MKKCEDAKAKEGSCGAMMKGCGEGMAGCGEMMKNKEGTCGAGMKMPEHKGADVLNKAGNVKIIPAK